MNASLGRCTYDDVFSQAREHLAQQAITGIAGHPKSTLFYGLSDGKNRAKVFTITANSFNTAWEQLLSEFLLKADTQSIKYIDINLVTDIKEISTEQLKKTLETTRRNYFRYGIALDNKFNYAFTEKELNANAMLYGGNKIEGGMLNEKNFHIYAKNKYKNYSYKFKNDNKIFLFACQGVFLDLNRKESFVTYPTGLHAGRRVISELNKEVLNDLINTSSEYLSSQVNPDTGRFYYGWHPCFDRYIDNYNTLRHASSVYAMLEAWEVTRSASLLVSIEKAIGYLLEEYVKDVNVNGTDKSFLIDSGNEIKLGGTAACLLMLCKYTELINQDKHMELLNRLALGIMHMQQADSSFIHVLNYPDLSMKEKFRIVYYDGEAIFALMRLYKIIEDQKILSAVERAIEYFIENNYSQYNDHWLAYAVKELISYKPEVKYYKFAIDNVKNHLGFILNRVTTFPTLLELMTATEQVISKLSKDENKLELLDELNTERFYLALHSRANYLLNGYFWPEYAMYYKNPLRIAGSFFIRHHAFRVRIDDVEHYLSGLIAYKKFINTKN